MSTRECPRDTDGCACTWPNPLVANTFFWMLRIETLPHRSLGGILRFSREVIAEFESEG